MRNAPVMSDDFANSESARGDIDIRRISAAVLHSAIFDFFDIGAFMRSPSEVMCPKQISLYQWRAWKWLFDCEDDDSPFSFIWVCQSLSLDPDYMRDGLTHHVERTIKACRKNLPAY